MQNAITQNDKINKKSISAKRHITPHGQKGTYHKIL